MIMEKKCLELKTVVVFFDAKTTVDIPTNNDMNLDETRSDDISHDYSKCFFFNFDGINKLLSNHF